jgi:hypothetical protein
MSGICCWEEKRRDEATRGLTRMTWINPARRRLADSSAFRSTQRNFALCKQSLLLSLTASRSGVTYLCTYCLSPRLSTDYEAQQDLRTHNSQDGNGTVRRGLGNALRKLRCVLVGSQMPLTPGSPSRSLPRSLPSKVTLDDVQCLPLFLVTSQRKGQVQIS